MPDRYDPTRGEWDHTLGRYLDEPACNAPKGNTNVRCTRAKDHDGGHVAAVRWESWT